ncbi:MAG: class I SAM-dependent methyltransferase, partial [Candidatus Bathyarchaeota archaeon]|nr:class I SAM-dependent methyltransferase [Candidatus Bathyarchaeota archaeon]
TKVLLNSLRKDSSINYSKILDIGCGYGPIGLFLKKQDTSRDVHMVDRDALAVAFTAHNAELNGLSISAYPSVDYKQVEGKFSFIITNFPAKLGINGLQAFVYGASNHLTKDGVLALVVVRELTQTLLQVLEGQPINIIYKEHKNGYSIFHVTFSKPVCPPEHSYKRKEMVVPFSKKYPVKTSYGLPEFDTLDFGTRATYNLLKKMKDNKVSSVLVLEPRQGHIAIAALDILKPKEIVLCSRDLLSLSFAENNVKENFDVQTSTIIAPYLLGPPEQDLTIWSIQRKNDLALNTYNLQILLKSSKPVILYGHVSLLETLLRKQSVTVLKESTQGKFVAQLIKASN